MKEELYDIKDLVLRKHYVLAEKINVPVKKAKSGIIIPGQEEKPAEYLEDFVDHPLQGKVILVGPGIEEFFPKGLKVGDIIYFSGFNGAADAVNIKGDTFIRLNANAIFMVRQGIGTTKIKGDA